MKKTIGICAVLTLMMVAGTANALTWNFTNVGDYWTNNAVVNAGSAYVAPLAVDEAAVFARINTQAPGLKVGDITGGGFTVSGINNPNAVYGSLYLSPTGAGGSTVLINISPMVQTGSGGALVYTFDLNTPADVLTNSSNWTYAQPQGALNFGQVIGWVNTSAYSGTYAAFFGPQIGESGTSGTTFTVSQIELSTVPEPVTMLSVFGAVAGIGAYLRRRMAA